MIIDAHQRVREAGRSPSGLYPGTRPDSWTPGSIRPFVDRALEVFGVNRLMYGGDWPISVAAGGYDRVFRGLGEVLAGLSEGERQEIYAGTAARFYRIDPERLETSKIS